jgi:hypothetical protein
MARKVQSIIIDDKGRDYGKEFVITEMSSYAAERWALKALSALIKAGFEIPDETAGMAGIATAGFEAIGKLDFEIAEPLLDEMFDCIKIKPSEKAPPRNLIDDDIEEIKTRIKLRMEVFKLHLGFSDAAV